MPAPDQTTNADKNTFELFSLLYQGIFEGFKFDSRQPPEKIESKKEEIRTKLATITQSTELSPQFRSLLCNLNAIDFEILLYGVKLNDKNSLLDRYKFPPDTELLAKFNLLNQKYKFFNSDKDKKDAFEQFISLFKACKLMGDFVEENNDPLNETAYLHAYKMLGLFGLSKNHLGGFQNFSKNHMRQTNRPVFDSLFMRLPINEPILDLVGWQKLIMKLGPKAIRAFQTAEQIENINGKKAPKDLISLTNLSSKIKYQRQNEYTKLADLCLRYNVPENIFNKCLEIEKTRIDQDILPDIVLDGGTQNHSGYFLVKDPKKDPRAYIWGDILISCQSVGGNSEQCVIDGLTYKDKGFYVFLKLKGDPKQPLFLNDGNINYDHYEPLGQGHAWLSLYGNLVFDSWENLRTEIDDPLLFKLLTEYAKQTTKKHDDIAVVTIGSGGKTPKEFKNKFIKSELMLRGYQYGDSLKQYPVYIDREKIAAIRNALTAEWDKAPLKPFNLSRKDFFLLMQLNKTFSVRYNQHIKQVFIDNAELWNTLNQQDFAIIHKNMSPYLLYLFNTLNELNYLQTENVWKILDLLAYLNNLHEHPFNISKQLKELIIAIENLHSKNKLDPEVLSLILHQSIFVLTGINILDSANMLNYYEDALSHPNHADLIALAYKQLNDEGLFNETYRQLILTNFAQADDIARTIVLLNKNGLLTEANLNKLIDNKDNLTIIRKAMNYLNANDLKENLLTEKFYDLIFTNPSESYNNTIDLIDSLEHLKKAKLFTDENKEDYLLYFQKYWSQLEPLAKAIGLLAKSDLLNKEILLLVIEDPNMALSLSILFNKKILDKKSLEEILKTSTPNFIFQLLSKYDEKDLLTPEIKTSLISNPQKYEALLPVLHKIDEINLSRYLSRFVPYFETLDLNELKIDKFNNLLIIMRYFDIEAKYDKLLELFSSADQFTRMADNLDKSHISNITLRQALITTENLDYNIQDLLEIYSQYLVKILLGKSATINPSQSVNVATQGMFAAQNKGNLLRNKIEKFHTDILNRDGIQALVYNEDHFDYAHQLFALDILKGIMDDQLPADSLDKFMDSRIITEVPKAAELVKLVAEVVNFKKIKTDVIENKNQISPK